MITWQDRAAAGTLGMDLAARNASPQMMRRAAVAMLRELRHDGPALAVALIVGYVNAGGGTRDDGRYAQLQYTPQTGLRRLSGYQRPGSQP